LPNAPFCDSSKYIWQSPASPLALCDDRTDGKSAPSPFDRDGPLFAMSPPVALNGFVVATECYRLVECLHMPCTLADVALHRLNASILRLEPKGRSCAGGPSDIVLAGTLVKMAMATHGWHISEVKWARTLDCDADEVEELERCVAGVHLRPRSLSWRAGCSRSRTRSSRFTPIVSAPRPAEPLASRWRPGSRHEVAFGAASGHSLSLCLYTHCKHHALCLIAILRVQPVAAAFARARSAHYSSSR
jgi:hypothetical protein